MDQPKPRIGDVLLVTLPKNEMAARYRVHGVLKDHLKLRELYCEDGELVESATVNELKWDDIRDLRFAPEPDC